MNVLKSAALNPVEHGRHGVEFVCEHCGSESLWLVDASEKIVKVECMSCGKESVVERVAGPTPPAKPRPLS